MSLATMIGLAAIAWPLALGAALVDRLDGHATLGSVAVYVAAARVCHQRPERSFSTAGVSWPVCGRCAGLYLAAPVGVLWAAAGRHARRRGSIARWLAIAAVPTAATWLAEVVLAVPVGTVSRFVAALPLGGAVAWALLQLTRREARVD